MEEGEIKLVKKKKTKVYIGFSCESDIKESALIVARSFGNISLGSICRMALKAYLENLPAEIKKELEK